MGQESQDDTGVSYMSAQKVLVFSGTSEGNTISRWLKDNGIDVTVSVATEYGSRNTDGDLNVHYGSYGGVEGISKEIREKGYDMVIDATHPYAISISAPTVWIIQVFLQSTAQVQIV